MRRPEEEWGWEAHYLDGSILKQFDDEGKFHKLREIQEDRLKVFWMIEQTVPHRRYGIVWRAGLKLIHYYDRYVLRDEAVRFTIYCFGYEEKLGFSKRKVIKKIMPDGNLIEDSEDKTRFDLNGKGEITMYVR